MCVPAQAMCRGVSCAAAPSTPTPSADPFVHPLALLGNAAAGVEPAATCPGQSDAMSSYTGDGSAGGQSRTASSDHGASYS